MIVTYKGLLCKSNSSSKSGIYKLFQECLPDIESAAKEELPNMAAYLNEKALNCANQLLYKYQNCQEVMCREIQNYLYTVLTSKPITLIEHFYLLTWLNKIVFVSKMNRKIRIFTRTLCFWQFTRNHFVKLSLCDKFKLFCNAIEFDNTSIINEVGNLFDKIENYLLDSFDLYKLILCLEIISSKRYGIDTQDYIRRILDIQNVTSEQEIINMLMRNITKTEEFYRQIKSCSF